MSIPVSNLDFVHNRIILLKGVVPIAVLITGGYGHIGSWAAYLMAKAGEKVFVIDTHPLVPDCLSEVYEDITFIKGDVMDFPHLIQIFQQYGDEIDGIIHTVAIMGGDVSQNPHQNVTLNIGGLLNMLEIRRTDENRPERVERKKSTRHFNRYRYAETDCLYFHKKRFIETGQLS